MVGRDCEAAVRPQLQAIRRDCRARKDMATGGEEERNCVTILWRIENISKFDKDIHGSIESPVLDIFTDKRLNLRYRPRDKSEEDENLDLSFSNWWVGFNVPIDIEFSLLRCDASPLVTRTLRDQVIKPCIDIYMPDSPTQKEVFVTRKSEFLPHDTLTVRCRIWKSRGNFETAQFISARSRIEVSEASLLVPIEKLRKDQKDVYIRAPKTELFELICSLEGDSLRNYVLNVQLDADEISGSLVMNLKVSILGDEQEIGVFFERKHTFTKSDKNQTWTVSDMNLGELLLKKKHSFGSDENFNLVFHFTGVGKVISECIDKTWCGKSNLEHGKTKSFPILLEASCQTDQKCCPDTPNNVDHMGDSVTTLVEDFRSLYCKQNFSDFTLRSGEVSFPVHKNVLSARSPVFEAMFSSDMKESGTDSMDIPDLDCHTLNRMLAFLYTGTLEPDLEWESAAKVYYAADKYQVDTLKQECSSVLKSAISVSNVSQVLTLAHKHHYGDLTSFAHDFIRNRFDEVMNSVEWENFMENDPYLAGKSMLFVCKNKKRKTHH